MREVGPCSVPLLKLVDGLFCKRFKFSLNRRQMIDAHLANEAKPHEHSHVALGRKMEVLLARLCGNLSKSLE